VLRFLESCPPGGCQIVNLGAGFDTTYFWLRDSEERWRSDLTMFEVDFPEVLSKKTSAICRRQALWPMLDATTQEELVAQDTVSGIREVRTKHLRYVATDMRMIPELTAAMSAAGFRSDVPTLFLSECVMVYMQALHGDSIISWASSAVPDAPSAFIVYEQTNPNDPFGKVMVDNLMRRGCPLLSIHDYPTLAAQQDRYTDRGWDKVVAFDMNSVYDKHLDIKDVERIQRLELLDEFEEWHLIQAHYFLLVATRTPSAENDTKAEQSEWVNEIPIFLAKTAKIDGDCLPHAT